MRIRGVEVLLFHVLSPEEVRPTVEGEVVLVDQETGAERAVDGVTYARHHAAHLAAFREQLEQVCHDTETELCAVTTDQPLDEALQRFMHLRNGAS